ncbi:MAG: hypothetical protein AB1714_08230 [Acidobacteriota bacterium]
MAESGPKSAIEIAMERLRQKDAEEGIEPRPLSDEQKTAIAEVRNYYRAKVAEREVLHLSDMARTIDPEARAKLEEQFRHDRDRFMAERDAKVEGIRKGEP